MKLELEVTPEIEGLLTRHLGPSRPEDMDGAQLVRASLERQLMSLKMEESLKAFHESFKWARIALERHFYHECWKKGQKGSNADVRWSNDEYADLRDPGNLRWIVTLSQDGVLQPEDPDLIREWGGIPVEYEIERKWSDEYACWMPLRKRSTYMVDFARRVLREHELAESGQLPPLAAGRVTVTTEVKAEWSREQEAWTREVVSSTVTPVTDRDPEGAS